MKRELNISSGPIDEAALLRQTEAMPLMGAIVRFLGVVRGMEGDQPIVALEYEAFASMAEHQFSLIFNQLEKRWPIHSVRLIHRVGVVRAGEPSLWVEVIAPHRSEAFAACEYLINEMKRVVPIWKRPLADV